MPIVTINQQICFVRLELRAGEIRGLLERHVLNYPGAADLEQRGLQIIESGFPSAETGAFVEAVVRWGGGQRFVGRLLDQNKPETIGEVLIEADNKLQLGQVAEAVSTLQRLRYLGQSFASKVARFLHPDRAVILDEVIRGALGYRESQIGYQEFLGDCKATLALLSPDHPHLRICDVEAAIFAKIQGY